MVEHHQQLQSFVQNFKFFGLCEKKIEHINLLAGLSFQCLIKKSTIFSPNDANTQAILISICKFSWNFSVEYKSTQLFYRTLQIHGHSLILAYKFLWEDILKLQTPHFKFVKIMRAHVLGYTNPCACYTHLLTT